MSRPSVSARWHGEDVRRYASTHGRVRTWLYATRRLWIAVLLAMPVVLFVSWTLPFIGLALIVVWSLHTVGTEPNHPHALQRSHLSPP